ncbi:MAG: aminotransferase class V-fold PLP-dependent enzyme [Ruminococcaceae bacterium]|nr:aminotransferase class V-fold PLP-dependent enzyme [Oscillospiraceae bacterium]
MIYFDNAATTFPKPPEVVRAMVNCLKNLGGNPGRGAHPLALAAAEAVYDARSEISSFFGGTKPENVVFTQNATQALNTAIFGAVKPGDHILISNLEHNSVYRPVSELYRRGIASYTVFDALGTSEQTLLNIEKAFRRNTRIVITTHASNICPKVLPVKEISALCRARGLYHIIDASQSAGIYELDINDGASIICAPGHKGLYGPQGSGFCLFADDFDFGTFSPSVFGGNGLNSEKSEMGHTPPESFEAGTLAVPNITGLCEGVRFVKRLGLSRIQKYEESICERILSRLRKDDRIKIYTPAESTGATILLNVSGKSSAQIASSLSEKGICTRAGMHCSPLAHDSLGTGGDALRLSFSVFNTEKEADEFLRIFENII